VTDTTENTVSMEAYGVTDAEALTVECPRCHAAPGGWCDTSATGGPTVQATSLHHPRRRAYLADPAVAALRATSTEALLSAAYSLTHRIHVGEGRGQRRRPMTDAEVADLRAQRDLITAEIVRRSSK
jgi:hypothetical protein